MSVAILIMSRDEVVHFVDEFHHFRLVFDAASFILLAFDRGLFGLLHQKKNKAQYSTLHASRRRFREGVTDLRTDRRTDGLTL